MADRFSVPNEACPAGNTVSAGMARATASVLRPLKAARTRMVTQGAMHLVRQIADGQHGHS